MQIRRQRRPENRLGFALQLCALRYLGFHPNNWQQAPWDVVKHLSQQLQVQPENLSRYAQRTQTRTEHLQQIQNYLGFQEPTPAQIKRLARWLLDRAMEHDKP